MYLRRPLLVRRVTVKSKRYVRNNEAMAACVYMHGRRAGFCLRCDEPLVYPQRRWCSKSCADWWRNNHWFSAAKMIAKRRAAIGPYRWECAMCEKAVAEVEVDHILPANGTHSLPTCLHHTDNLRVLCVPCHRHRTEIQWKQMRAGSK